MGRSDYFDELETRSPDEREEALFARLPAQIRNAQENAPAYAALLEGVQAQTVHNRNVLAQLPVTRKSELISLQREAPPFGGFAAVGKAGLGRVFASPGPIFEPEACREDYWRFGRSLYAAGFRRGDLIHNSFAYHFTPAGFMVESGARAVGCAVFPAGVGQTDLQIEAMARLRPQGYVGTPSFLKVLLEKAKEVGMDLSSVSKALVGGEALPPSLRREIGDLGVETLQNYGTADLGLIAYESSAKEGLILDEHIIVEIVTPGTGDPVPDGEIGEVLVTTFNPEYPLIRFATGDLSAIMEGTSPCGRTNLRIKGWMGRADQTVKVKGMFVHPSQVADVVRCHPEIISARLVIRSKNNYDQMTLQCEVENPAQDALSAQIASSVREVCKLRCEVDLVERGRPEKDGKVIDDRRSFE